MKLKKIQKKKVKLIHGIEKNHYEDQKTLECRLSLSVKLGLDVHIKSTYPGRLISAAPSFLTDFCQNDK